MAKRSRLTLSFAPQVLLAHSPRFQALLDRSRQSIKEGKGLSEEEFWQAVRKRAQERKAAAKDR
jgi:hypothetical protein